MAMNIGDFSGKIVTLCCIGKTDGSPFLSAVSAPSVTIDTFAQDDGSGRQRWELVPVPGAPSQFYVRLAEPSRRWYLGAWPCERGNGVDLYSEVDSDRQKWAFEQVGTGFSVRLVGGRGGGPEYLSCHGWDRGVDLWGSVGPEGRQTWVPKLVDPGSAGMRLMPVDAALKFPGWGASSKRNRISYDAATGSIRIDYPAHPHASAGGTNWSFKPTGVKLPAREARVAFSIYIPQDFPFEASGASAGKIGSGFHIGPGSASGGNWSSSGASFRLIWLGAESYGSQAVAYVYTEVSDPGNFRGTIDQAPGILDTAVLTNGGMNLWREHMQNPCQFYKGKWNECEMYAKVNTPGNHDGVIEMTIDGVTQRIDNFRWVLSDSNSLIESFLMTSWFGGSASDPQWAPGRPCYSLVRNIRVWTG